MVSEETTSDGGQLIRSLYPNASSEQLSEAQQLLTDYVAAVLRISDRITHERESDSRVEEDRSRIQAVKSNEV